MFLSLTAQIRFSQRSVKFFDKFFGDSWCRPREVLPRASRVTACATRAEYLFRAYPNRVLIECLLSFPISD